jgi:hypothetical protein
MVYEVLEAGGDHKVTIETIFQTVLISSRKSGFG